MRLSLLLFISCFSAPIFAASPCADRLQASDVQGPEAAIAYLIGTQRGVAQLVDGFGRKTPLHLNLEFLRQTEGEIEIQGVAEDLLAIGEYLTTINETPWLKKLELLSLSEGLRHNQKITIFKIKTTFIVSQCLPEKTPVNPDEKTRLSPPPHPAKSGKAINEMARKVGFEFVRFNPRMATVPPQEQLWEIEGLADYRSIAHFLGLLSQLPYAAVPENLTIQATPDSLLRLNVKMDIRIANTAWDLEIYDAKPPETLFKAAYSAPPFDFDEGNLEALQDPFSTWLSPVDLTASPLTRFPLKQMTLLAVECGPDGHVDLRDPEGGTHSLKKGERVGPEQELIIGFDCPGVRIKTEYAMKDIGSVIVMESTVPMADGVYVLE
jgi:hypothetical protein